MANTNEPEPSYSGIQKHYPYVKYSSTIPRVGDYVYLLRYDYNLNAEYDFNNPYIITKLRFIPLDDGINTIYAYMTHVFTNQPKQTSIRITIENCYQYDRAFIIPGGV